jgi:hypothetical protein
MSKHWAINMQAVKNATVEKVRKNVFCARHVMLKMISLPRQARDKHNGNSKTGGVFSQGGFTWQNFVCIDGKTHGNGELCTAETPPQGSQCANFLRSSCRSGSLQQTSAVTYTISHAFSSDHSTMNLTKFDMDLAVFLTTRGNFSWLGYGWLGCGCGWEYDGKMPCDIYHRPASLDVDYGVPTEFCQETEEGVFTREWSKSTVTVDCNAYTSEIRMKA